MVAEYLRCLAEKASWSWDALAAQHSGNPRGQLRGWLEDTAAHVASGSGQTGGLGLVVQQIETIGPRQWLSLMAGSIVFSAPVSQRIARAFPRRFVPFASGIIGGNTA